MRFVLILILGCYLSLEAAVFDGAFPQPVSKKGLQVEIVEDAIQLGVKHAALNVDLCALVNPGNGTNAPFAVHDGYVRGLDQRIKTLSDQGMVVYLILLTYQSGNPEVNRLMIHPRCDANAPNRLGAFNTATDEGKRWLRDTIEFMAARWSGGKKENGQVWGYIVGNEVNSHWWWSNMGAATMEEFTDAYLPAVRITHDAVRTYSANARVYLSLEHHWNIRFSPGEVKKSFEGRPFMEYFAKKAREGGDFDWHLAFHPYPENLFEPRFWNDKTATTNENTPRITFKNVEMLQTFMEKPEMLFHGKTRRVIFSEQGFHTPEGPDGETIQAAAYCYAYKKIEKLNGVDAFILHRHVDHPHEGGLWLGLRSLKPQGDDQRPRKKIYECFRMADTPQWREAFEFALPIVGLKNWE